MDRRRMARIGGSWRGCAKRPNFVTTHCTDCAMISVHCSWNRRQAWGRYQMGTAIVRSRSVVYQGQIGPTYPIALVGSDYAQHAAYLFVDSLSAIRLQQPEGYASFLSQAPIHNFLTGMLMDGSGI